MNKAIIDHETGQVLPNHVTPRFNIKNKTPVKDKPQGFINSDLTGLIICVAFCLVVWSVM